MKVPAKRVAPPFAPVGRALLRAASALLLLGAVAALVVPEVAEAQQRRRRRRRPPPVQVEPPPLEAPRDVPETPGGAPDGADGPAPPGSDPAAGEAAVDGADPGPLPPDLAPIRADVQALVDELVQVRSSVHALGQELFRTRVEVRLQDRVGDHQGLARLVVHLDGAPIFRADGPVEGGPAGRELFAGALSPGPHVLMVEVEQRARADDAFRYTLRDTYRFQVERDRLAQVEVTLLDASTMGRTFPRSGEGRYEPRTRIRVVSRPLPEGAAPAE
ncbi:MAG: hypothetical protein ACFCGT_00170 [Sandaracinaceae bacterium]